MKIIFLLILISLSVALVFLGVFVWSVKSGQYDDTISPANRMLWEDEVVRDESSEK